MTKALEYESLIRYAFSMNGQQVGRWGDPAGLANTDNFNDRNLNSVKAATSYSIECINSAILNNDGSTFVPDAQRDILVSYTSRVLSASSTSEISEIISDYQENVINPSREAIDLYKS